MTNEATPALTERGVLHTPVPVPIDGGGTACGYCGGLLAAVTSGYEHADDPATREAIRIADSAGDMATPAERAAGLFEATTGTPFGKTERIVGAHELAAAKLIVQYGTLDIDVLPLVGADDSEIGAAAAVLSWGPLDPEQVHATAQRMVPEQVYGKCPPVSTFATALAAVDERRESSA